MARNCMNESEVVMVRVIDVQSMVPKQRGVIESRVVKVIERHALKAQYRIGQPRR